MLDANARLSVNNRTLDKLPALSWHRLYLGYASLLSATVLVVALDLSMDTVRTFSTVLTEAQFGEGQWFATRGQFLGFYLGYSVLPIVAMVLLAVVSLVIAWGVQGEEDASILATLLVVSGTLWTGTFILPAALMMHESIGVEWDYYRPGFLPPEMLLGIGFVLLFPGLLRFSVFFPQRVAGHGVFEAKAWTRRLKALSLSLRTPVCVAVVLIAGATLAEVSERTGVLVALGAVSFLAALCLMNLGVGIARSSAKGRSRIAWATILLAAAAGVPPVSLMWFSAVGGALWSSGLFLSGALVVLCLLAAFVVFGMGAIDPKLAIQRTVLYSILAIGGVFAFGVVETAVTDLLIAKWGLPSGAGAMIAGGVMAVSFRPVHRAVEGVLSKLFGETNTD